MGTIDTLQTWDVFCQTFMAVNAFQAYRWAITVSVAILAMAPLPLMTSHDLSGVLATPSASIRRQPTTKAAIVAHVVLLGVTAALIYFASEWFVNAIEWLGSLLGMRTLAVGTVLAAIGTALPETIVTLMAVLSGGASGAEIGQGAALGGPLVLATLGYGLAGFLLLQRARGGGLHGVDRGLLRADQRLFLGIAIVALVLGFTSFPGKALASVAFLAVYAIYVLRELRPQDAHDDAAELEALKLWRSPTTPKAGVVVAQTLLSLLVVVWASRQFVSELAWAAPGIGLPPAAVALLLAPVATELPEIMNAVIWIRQGKTPLALANISGSMMVQVTVPVAIGLIFTPWQFGPVLLLASLTTIGAIGYQLVIVRGERFTPRWLATTASFYLGFGAGLALLFMHGLA